MKKIFDARREQLTLNLDHIGDQIAESLAKAKAAQGEVSVLRENHGKAVVTSREHDSDDDDDHWDPRIEASSTVGYVTESSHEDEADEEASA